jgi:uncharacterized membrane protein YhaH (DUF805 family)
LHNLVKGKKKKYESIKFENLACKKFNAKKHYNRANYWWLSLFIILKFIPAIIYDE